eukprot:m.308142 g.308142  ORF g.308142 m.308142 type:complete len:707 (+) comp43446_c0_seq1:124-2244(+)
MAEGIQYRKKLKQISDELTSRELSRLKQLCAEDVPTSRREKAKTGQMLFNQLEELGLIERGNLDYLIRLLERLQRIDVITKFDLRPSGRPAKQKPRLLPEHTFRGLLDVLSEGITSVELETLKQLCVDCIPGGVRQYLNDPQCLFTELESRNLVAKNSLDFLIDLMDALDRRDLIRVVKEFQKNGEVVKPQGAGGHALTLGPRVIEHVPVTYKQEEEDSKYTFHHREPIIAQPTSDDNNCEGIDKCAPSGGDSLVLSKHSGDHQKEMQMETTPRSSYSGKQKEVVQPTDGSFMPPIGSLTYERLNYGEDHERERNHLLEDAQTQARFKNIEIERARREAEEAKNHMEAMRVQVEMEQYQRQGAEQRAAQLGRENRSLEQEMVLLQQARSAAAPGRQAEEAQRHVDAMRAQLEMAHLQRQEALQRADQADQDKRFLEREMAALQQSKSGPSGALAPSAMKDLPCYDMTKNPRGYAVIISIGTFRRTELRLGPRQGTATDVRNLEQAFQKLHFTVKVHTDCSSTEIVSVMREYGKEDHTNFDCFVCCLLSHGKKDFLYGSDSVPVPISQIASSINGLACPSLNNKPKLFFIQACRGAGEDEGVETDSLPQRAQKDAQEQVKIPLGADFLLGYSTPPETVSFRSTTHGSWYVCTLVAVLKEYAHLGMSLTDMLTLVNHRLAQATTSEGLKQIPSPINQLTKRLVFTPTS